MIRCLLVQSVELKWVHTLTRSLVQLVEHRWFCRKIIKRHKMCLDFYDLMIGTFKAHYEVSHRCEQGVPFLPLLLSLIAICFGFSIRVWVKLLLEKRASYPSFSLRILWSSYVVLALTHFQICFNEVAPSLLSSHWSSVSHGRFRAFRTTIDRGQRSPTGSWSNRGNDCKYYIGVTWVYVAFVCKNF